MSKKWYKLDNVGKFFSSVTDKHNQNVFRYSATLTETIDKKCLQKALEETINIFPNFNVNLKKGLFWYYLDETKKKYIVTEENLPICFKLYNNSNDFLYRVSYYNKRINFEVSHILSDGRGSVEFFKVLVGNYLKIKYNLKDINILTNSSYNEKEEDSFIKYYQKNKQKNENNIKGKIYHYKGRKLKNNARYLETHMPVKDILNISHKYNITLTTLIVSVIIYSFKDVMSDEDIHKNIKIDIPVDLRHFSNSRSSKNYFGLTSVTYKFKSRNDTLKQIIDEVNKQFKNNLTAENLFIRVNKMVAFEKNIFCRILPIFIKNIILKIINLFTSHMSTSCVSNIGIISFKKELMPYIKNVNILSSTDGFQFTLCSYNGDLSIGISSKYKYNDVIKYFCNYFSKQGIHIYINVSEVN